MRNVQEQYSIVIVTDEKSWFIPYAKKLLRNFISEGHKCTLRTNFDQNKNYDFCFLLSYSKIISEADLVLNHHNLVVHESALPKGRGWSPLTWQILHGERIIPITLFEADSNLDSGKIYMQKHMEFNGSELINEIREKQAEYTMQMCEEFVKNYLIWVKKGWKQDGESTYYRRRTPEDSQIDISKPIQEQFNLLRVVDNERYPAYFNFQGEKYILKIYREEVKAVKETCKRYI